MGQGTGEDAKQMMQQVSVALVGKKNVLLYPQGELCRQGYQSIIGKKTAFYAVQNAPKNTKLITITIRGLRGSRSSYARNGKTVNLFLFLVKGLWFLLLNLFVFTPKRTVSIQLSDATEWLKKAELQGLDFFNVQLEKLYNAQGEEQIQYLSGLWFYDTVQRRHVPTKVEGSLDSLRKRVDYSQLKYPKDTLHYITQRIAEIKPDHTGSVDLSTNLILDLHFDSLDMAELKSSVATHFPQASNPPLLDLKAVGDMILMAMGKSPYVEELKSCDWQYPENHLPVYPGLNKKLIKQDTILTMLKKNFNQDKNLSFCYDQLFGVQSRNDFMIKAYLIADILKTFP